MFEKISSNTKAILLLTAPLNIGRNEDSHHLLTHGEYKSLVSFLNDIQRQPSDLLGSDAEEILKGCSALINEERIKSLLSRGFLLSQAIERWHARSIWVVSRADSHYPKKLRVCLKKDAPAILYGCGNIVLLDSGGLAVVGSRHVDDELIRYTQGIGSLVAKANQTLVSGGARGIDQAAMRGALSAGGTVIGVLGDSLEKASLNHEYRNMIKNDQLVLISPYDPNAGFHVGHAMQRNKMIYALSNAALVVSSDVNKGGTWAGAIEQLEKLKFVPVYVRSSGDKNPGLDALQHRGALVWPNPTKSEELLELLQQEVIYPKQPVQQKLEFEMPDSNSPVKEDVFGSQLRLNKIQDMPLVSAAVNFEKSYKAEHMSPSEELFRKVQEIILRLLNNSHKKVDEVALELHVSNHQAKEWLYKLADEGVLVKYSNPVRFGVSIQKSLFSPSEPEINYRQHV